MARAMRGTAVVGLSIAGVAAALRLAAIGQNTYLLEHHVGSGWLADTYRVFETPLNGKPVSGEDYEEIAMTQCREA